MINIFLTNILKLISLAGSFISKDHSTYIYGYSYTNVVITRATFITLTFRKKNNNTNMKIIKETNTYPHNQSIISYSKKFCSW